MNGNQLKAKIIARGFTIRTFCEAAGFVRSTFDRKLRGEYEFDRAEIERIQIVLNLTDEELRFIFFTKMVA